MVEAAPEKTLRFWEEEMLAEYLATRWPQTRVLTRVRLGPVKPEGQDPTLTAEEQKLLGSVWRRWADAVLITDTELIVVEAKLIPDPRDVSQLELYLHLAAVTPELAEVRHLPRRGLLVFGVDDPFTSRLAAGHGLSVEIFRPSNWGAWLRSKRDREKRKTRPVLTRIADCA